MEKCFTCEKNKMLLPSDDNQSYYVYLRPRECMSFRTVQ